MDLELHFRGAIAQSSWVLQVEPTLNILVFGESIINDAVAVVLFNLVNMDEPTDHSSGRLTLLTLVWLTCLLVVVSLQTKTKGF